MPSREAFLPFALPSIGDDEIAEMTDTLRSGWVTTGPKVGRFEQEFRSFVGAPAAVALSSCTSALHVALSVLSISPGDRVITTPLTFCSTVNVIEHLGARPTFVDVEPDTLNLDPDRLAAVLREPSQDAGPAKAVIPVHYAGHPCAMDEIVALAAEHGLAVVEDAAHAVPAVYRGRMVGACDDQDVRRAACFSFYATKNLTTGEGGMLTGTSEFVERARALSLHGITRNAWRRYGKGASWYYEVEEPGFKYNMTDVQASMGLHQLRRLDSLQARRRDIVERYQEAFGGIDELETPTERGEVESSWHLYPIRLRVEALRIDRDAFIEELATSNIGTSVHFIPVHVHPYYRDKYGYKPEDFPVAYREYQRLLSLPLYPRMGPEDTEDVVSAVIDVVRRHRKAA